MGESVLHGWASLEQAARHAVVGARDLLRRRGLTDEQIDQALAGGDQPVALYRLEVFNGTIASPTVFRLAYPDDQAAIEAAERYSQTRRMELWQGDRLVRRFDVVMPRAGPQDPI